VKVHNVHERRVAAPPDEVTALFSDMDRLWPTQMYPAPQPVDGRLRVGPMLWQPVERSDAPAAYRIVSPADFPADHWFDVRPDGQGGTLLRHTVEGDAVGPFESVWRDRIEPLHDAFIEALFDRAQEEVS
jgi:carbon monoxide dehydrogenase subunit G